MEGTLDYSELITRFLEKNIGDDELVFLTSWISESSQNRKLFDQCNEVWQVSHVVFTEGQFNTDAGWNSLQKTIRKSSTNTNKNFQLVDTNQLVIWKAASLIAMLVAALFIGLYIQKTNKNTKYQTVTIQSTPGKKSKVILAESTVVCMNSERQLICSTYFDCDTQVVSRSDEDYFDVKNDPYRPIMVGTKNVDIKVCGKRINVNSYPAEQQAENKHEEGKIGVFITGTCIPITYCKSGTKICVQ